MQNSSLNAKTEFLTIKNKVKNWKIESAPSSNFLIIQEYNRAVLCTLTVLCESILMKIASRKIAFMSPFQDGGGGGKSGGGGK